MRLRPLLAALLLTACAASPPPPVSTPLPYPPSAAERVLRLAREEWREWGALTRDAWEPAPPEIPESTPANFPRVLAYWRAVPEDHGAIPDNRARFATLLAGGEPAAPLWSNPAWSAAFISWVFATAGVDRREFPSSATHSLYLDGLIADAAAFPASAPFLPLDPTAAVPALGDLVCIDRSPAPLSHWTARLAETGIPRPMHCDIVVRAAPGVVEAIGGNVTDAVALTRFRADSRGVLLPAPPGRAPLLVVMRSRLGKLAPWGG